MNKHNKTVNLSLVGVHGNAFAIMGVFRRQAKKEGWTQEEIDAVLDKAKQGNYDHLLTTIDSYCQPLDDEANE